MGVVRDVTIDQLTQAVQGISSTGISDSTGQAINNTLATLGKDTSLQGIITAINNLSGAISPAASNVTFDNTGTGLNASNVQAAITELNDFKLYYKVVSGTTNNYGFIDVGVNANEYTLISAIKLTADDNGVMTSPYRNTNASNSPQSLFVYNNNFVARANIAVTFLAFFAKKITQIT